jgi:hypothetical protein
MHSNEGWLSNKAFRLFYGLDVEIEKTS